jgi:hypothetical protein
MLMRLRIFVRSYVACSRFLQIGAPSTVCKQHAKIAIGVISSSLSTCILDPDWTLTTNRQQQQRQQATQQVDLASTSALNGKR